jgi:hypothetical protein
MDVCGQPWRTHPRPITTNLDQENRSSQNLPGILDQLRQQSVLHAGQGNGLAVEHHNPVAQMHE